MNTLSDIQSALEESKEIFNSKKSQIHLEEIQGKWVEKYYWFCYEDKIFFENQHWRTLTPMTGELTIYLLLKMP